MGLITGFIARKAAKKAKKEAAKFVYEHKELVGIIFPVNHNEGSEA